MANKQYDISFDYDLTRVDGTVMDPAEVAGMSVMVGNEPGVYTTVKANLAYPDNDTVITLDDTQPWYVAARTTDSDGRVSAYSAELSIPKGPVEPAAPVNGVVTPL